MLLGLDHKEFDKFNGYKIESRYEIKTIYIHIHMHLHIHIHIHVHIHRKRHNLGFKDNSLHAYTYCIYVCLLYVERDGIHMTRS